MSQKYPIGQLPIADPGPDEDIQPLFFDPRVTVLSQYANSPIMLTLIESWNDAIDIQASINQFYDLVWNVDTAQGYGLDVLGRIVGVSRTLHIPVPGDYLGFEGQDDADTFNHGIFFGAGTITQNYSVSDTVYRRMIMAKAALNITNGSISSINAIMMALFPDHDNCYVQDNLDMTITYVFGVTLTPPEYAIVTQSGVLPKPAGVSYTVDQP